MVTYALPLLYVVQLPGDNCWCTTRSSKGFLDPKTYILISFHSLSNYLWRFHRASFVMVDYCHLLKLLLQSISNPINACSIHQEPSFVSFRPTVISCTTKTKLTGKALISANLTIASFDYTEI